jgi:hypothetical protein
MDIYVVVDTDYAFRTLEAAIAAVKLTYGGLQGGTFNVSPGIDGIVRVSVFALGKLPIRVDIRRVSLLDHADHL